MKPDEIARVAFPDDGSENTVTEEERRTVLAIAHLVVVADDAVHPNERAALEALAQRLGVPMPPLESVGRDDADNRLLALAEELRSPTARALAYRTACALAHADADAGGEFEFDLQLIDALELDQDEADRIQATVTSSV